MHLHWTEVRCWQHKLLILDGNLDIHVPTLKTKPIFLVYWTPNKLFICLSLRFCNGRPTFFSVLTRKYYPREGDINSYVICPHIRCQVHSNAVWPRWDTQIYFTFLFSFHSHISFAMVYCHIFYPVWRHRVLYASSGYISAPSLKSVDHSL